MNTAAVSLVIRAIAELKLLLVNSRDADASSGLPYMRLDIVLPRGSGSCVGSTVEHICYNPKDSELCLARAKPQETGVEARSRCDVQIHGVSLA